MRRPVRLPGEDAPLDRRIVYTESIPESSIVAQRRNTVTPDKSRAPSTKPNVFTQSANGTTAGSYLIDGRYNIGGWSTYPSAEAKAASTRPPTNGATPRR